MQHRANNYDVSNTVQIDDAAKVCIAVRRLLQEDYPGESFDRLVNTFLDFARLYRGLYPGYHACNTVYHDMQHSLDVTLAAARLIYGYDLANPESKLGPMRAELGIVLALFHDSGYIRKRHDTRHYFGAEYTLRHVGRSARFISQYLQKIGLGDYAKLCVKLVHFTGYEIPIVRIRVTDPLDRQLGALVGSADLIAQMSDRLYLEKCQKYLYEEFVLGGIAQQRTKTGETKIVYSSPEDLLQKTPMFYATAVQKRLREEFKGVCDYAALSLGGVNLYLEAIERNMNYLQRVLDSKDFGLLRRTLS